MPTPNRNGAARLLDDPAVRVIIESRRRRYLSLSAVVCSVYLLVSLGCAFTPGLMRRPLEAGGSVSIGIASMVLVIVVGVACSGYYTWWSNTVRDRLIARLAQSPHRPK